MATANGLDITATYDLWAPTYPAVAHNALMRTEQRVVEPVLRRLRGTRALDLGTGSGRYMPILASNGARVVGVDLSRRMLERCAPSPRCSRLCADACRLPFSRCAFDIINASLMAGDVADLDGWCCEIARVLVLGGHFVYSDFHPNWSLHGWRRTFTDADGQVHELGFVPHTIDEHLAALERAHLRVDVIREPRVHPEDGSDAASVRSFLKRWSTQPVVVMFHAVKEGGWPHRPR